MAVDWEGIADVTFGKVASLFTGKKKKPKKLSTLDPQQRKLYDQKYEALMGRGPMADLYSFDPAKANSVFEQNVARPAYRQFQENIIPGITGQFRQGGIMNSSYTGEALGRAGRDVQEGLDAQRSQYLYNQETGARDARQRGVNDLLNMQTFAYQKPQDNPNFIDQILNKVAPAAGDWLANKFTGT